MRDAWQILRDGGLPLAMPASGSASRTDELAAAIREVIATQPAGREADALAAFVFAWHHHWPKTFSAELGDAAAATLDWAARHVDDDNRYLKLRRIALENLAKIL